VFIKEIKGRQMKNERRAFLKKVAYSAPVVVALGALVEPTESEAYERDGRTSCKNQKSKISKKSRDCTPR
jgi:hypothetical protein